MATSYSAVAAKPEEIVSCTALEAGDFPEKYVEKVRVISEGTNDDSLKEKLRQTLGCFEKGSAGNLIQSSPYRLVVLQQLLPEGKRLATMQRLRIARGNDYNFMAGFYVDGGLNLVPYTNANEAINVFQAGKLKTDLRKAGIKTNSARLVPYHVLTAEVDEKSPSGLVFRLSKEGKSLAKDAVRNTADFTWNCEPTQGGLFRAYLHSDGDWYCDDGNLDNSDRSGGVVVESAEGTSPKNLDSFLTNVQASSKKQLAELAERTRKAENYVRTGRLG